MRMKLVIRFGFGRHIPWVKRTIDNALLAMCGPDMVVLRSRLAVFAALLVPACL